MQILESTSQKQKSTDYICHTYFENGNLKTDLESFICLYSVSGSYMSFLFPEINVKSYIFFK